MKTTLQTWFDFGPCRHVLKVLLLAVLAVASGYAREPAQMGVSQLREQALFHAGQGTFAEGMGVFEEIVRRFQHASGEDRQLLESAYLFIGVGHMQRYGSGSDPLALERALESFSRYQREFPSGERRYLMHLFRADCYRGLGRWEEAVTDLETVLAPPLSDRLNRRQRLECLEKLTQALYLLEAWDRGLPWFRQLLAAADNPEPRTLAAAALTEATLHLERYDELPALLPYLTGEGPARYDVRFNLQLLRGGDQLTESGRYLEAALLYYLTLTRDELLDYWDRRIILLGQEMEQLQRNPLRIDPERTSELEIDQINARNQRDALREVEPYTAELEWRKARNFKDVGRDWEAFWAFWRLAEDYPERSELIEDYYYAAFIQAELLEAISRAEEIANRYLDREDWTRYRREISVTYAGLLLRTEQHERLIDFCSRYIERDPQDPFNAQLIYYLGATYLQLDRYDDLITQFAGYLKAYPWSAMEDGCHYWSGLAMLFTEDYQEAVAHLTAVAERFPNSPYFEDAQFRIGVAYFADDQHQEAERIFTAFITAYPESILRGEAELFLGDIASADARVGKAIRHYDSVAEFTEEIGFISHATFQKAKLLEANQRYEEMAEILGAYQETYGTRGELTVAIFEQGRAFELMGQPDQMLEAYLHAIRRYGNDPDEAGIDRILKAYPERYHQHQSQLQATRSFLQDFLSREPFREGLLADRRLLFDYFGENPEIDESLRERLLRDNDFRGQVLSDPEMLRETLEQVDRRLEALPGQSPVDTFRQLHAEAMETERTTLALRLGMALDSLGLTLDPGRIFTENEIAAASPATLVWMARRMAEYENLALRPLIRRAVTRILEDYDRVDDAVLEALMVLGELATGSADVDGALHYYGQVGERFPTSPRAVEAVLRQGDTLFAAGRYTDAIEKYENILKTRAWRGPAWAEAQYKIGLSHFRQERFDEAHAYFERTFLAFGQFRDWAALAYLRDAETLLRMGARDDARRTLEEFLSLPDAESIETYAEIQRLHRSIP